MLLHFPNYHLNFTSATIRKLYKLKTFFIELCLEANLFCTDDDRDDECEDLTVHYLCSPFNVDIVFVGDFDLFENLISSLLRSEI